MFWRGRGASPPTLTIARSSGFCPYRQPRVLHRVKKTRKELRSVSETVQSISYGYSLYSDRVCGRVRSDAAFFKWQGSNQFFADVSGPMTSCTFKVGSHGRTCWWFYAGEKESKLITCPFEKMQEKKVAICDPLGLSRYSVDYVIQRITDSPAIASFTVSRNTKSMNRSWTHSLLRTQPRGSLVKTLKLLTMITIITSSM